MLKNEQVSSIQNQWWIKVLTQHLSSVRDAFAPPLQCPYPELTLAPPIAPPLSPPLPQVKILFDECFYNSCDESYQVFCLEQPMEGGETKGVCTRNVWGGDRWLESREMNVSINRKRGCCKLASCCGPLLPELFCESLGDFIFHNNLEEWNDESSLPWQLDLVEENFQFSCLHEQLRNLYNNLEESHPVTVQALPTYKINIAIGRATDWGASPWELHKCTHWHWTDLQPSEMMS